METSRIFVRNLPVNVSDTDFQAHFAKRYAVTDIKLIPHRRIGYVGFQSPKDAQDAVKYFNKSFIRMSRLQIELAKPVNDASLHPTRIHGSAAGVATPTAATDANTLKRKRSSPPPSASDPKIKEFLDVMQRPSKMKSWANYNANVAQGEPTSSAQVKEQGSKSVSDDDYQPIDKKRKGKDITAGPKEGIKKLLEVDSTNVAQTAEDQALIASWDDDDWLKSRTGQMLGLEEDEESQPVFEEQDEISPSGIEHEANGDELKTNKQNVSEDPSGGERQIMSQTESDIRHTKRLFLRNLPFSVTEDALMEAFTHFGALAEVRSCHQLSSSVEGRLDYRKISPENTSIQMNISILMIVWMLVNSWTDHAVFRSTFCTSRMKLDRDS